MVLVCESHKGCDNNCILFVFQVINMLSAAQENSPMSVVQALDRVLVRMILLTDCIHFLYCWFREIGVISGCHWGYSLRFLLHIEFKSKYNLVLV